MSPRSSRVRNVFEPLAAEDVTRLWLSRFGVCEQAFSNCRFFRKAQSIWALSDCDLPRLSYETLGMRIMSCKDRPWKPTTAALQVFGRHANKNLVHLNRKEAAIFQEGGIQAMPEGEHEPGYVVVFYSGEVLGCGLYSHGKLVSQIPKERRISGQESDNSL